MWSVRFRSSSAVANIEYLLNEFVANIEYFLDELDQSKFTDLFGHHFRLKHNFGEVHTCKRLHWECPSLFHYPLLSQIHFFSSTAGTSSKNMLYFNRSILLLEHSQRYDIDELSTFCCFLNRAARLRCYLGPFFKSASCRPYFSRLAHSPDTITIAWS